MTLVSTTPANHFWARGFPSIFLDGTTPGPLPGIVADPQEICAVWFGMPDSSGIVDLSSAHCLKSGRLMHRREHCYGEVGTAGRIAGAFAVSGWVFLARLSGSIQAEAVIQASGKNKHG